MKRILCTLLLTSASITQFLYAQGSGKGLQGTYYNTDNLTGPSVATRLDGTINFSWPDGGPSPIPGTLNSAYISIRWEGKVEAPIGGTFLFKTRNDDATRLWVNDQLLIDDWPGNHSPELRQQSITLQAGQQYTIKLEFRQGNGGAQAQLLWEYPGQSEQIIPRERLYSAPLAATADLRYVKDFVGINTVNDGTPKVDGQQYWLAVKGRILAEEVQVQTGWADFVFEPTYQLPSLTSIETFIQQHGHLPNIPSAAEVAVQGISLGEMNARLLQKIEELTLHVIRQQKEIDELRHPHR